MHAKFSRIYTLYTTILISVFLLAYSSNPPNGRTNAPGDGYCADCHLPGNPQGLDGEITIENFPSTIDPNTDYTITVRVTNPNGLAFKAGFQAVVLDESNQNIGDISVSGTNPSTANSGGREYVEHTPAIVFPGSNEVTWDFVWTSPNGPDAETITMYAAGNIANGGAGNANDLVKSTTVEGTLTGGSSLNAQIIFSTNVSCNGGQDGSATVLAMDGEPPYSYAWPNGTTAAMVSNLSAGDHTVTVTDFIGATVTATASISEPDLLTTDVSSSIITCTESTSTATAIVSGGTSAYSYLWSTGGTGQTETGLPSGTYTVTVTDANNCTNTHTFSPQEDTETPTATIDPPQSIGCGINTVLLNGSASSTGPEFNYLWTTIDGNIIDGSTTTLATVDQIGTYTLTVSNTDNGCISEAFVTVNSESGPSLFTVSTDVSCANGFDGSIDLTVTGGQPPYTYQWDDANSTTTEDLMNVSAGQYCVIVTDNGGCTATICETIEEPSIITITGTTTDVCNGECDGTITVTANGGTGNYTYEWNTTPTQITSNISGICSGNYTVIVTDSNDCTEEATFTISENSLIIIAYNVVEPACADGCDGGVMPTVSGGAPPYTFDWSNGTSETDIIDLCAGDYSLTVTDFVGCTETALMTVGEPDPISITSTFEDPSCFGVCDGSIDIEIEGGTGAFIFEWSNGETTEDITNLCEDLYTVTVTDENDCTEILQLNIAGPDGLSIVPNIQDVDCNGACNGAVDIEVIGGTPPYTFEWSNGATNEDPENLCAGTNTVTVTDANACSASLSVSISEPDAINIDGVTTETTCGDCNGTIDLTISGGVTPFTFNWSQGVPGIEDPIDLCAGIYEVTVTDNNGCTAEAEFSVVEPAELLLEGSIINPVCPDECSGSISTSASGGTAPYSYEWSTGSTDSNLINLCEGQYDLTITDVNGCTVSQSFTLSDPIVLDPVISGNLLFCSAENTTLDGGVGYESYLWSNGATTQTILVSSSGTYSLTVTNENDCASSSSVVVTEAEEIVLSVSTTDVSTPGNNDGTATAEVGSQNIIAYIWNDPQAQTTQTATDLAPGLYCVTVSDIDGCTAESCGTVNDGPCDLTGSISSEDLDCFENNNGTALANVSGGTGVYTYNWSNGSNEMSIINLSAGSYSVTISDTDNCSIVLTTTISQPDQLSVEVQTTDVTCNGFCDGSTNLTVTGGTTPYSFQWSGPYEGEDPTGMCAGQYSVTVSDANGCSISTTVIIEEPTAITPIVTCTPESAPGAMDGTCSVESNGGTAPYTEMWSNGDCCLTIENLSPGTYCVTITDDQGCTGVSCGEVESSTGCDISLEIFATDITCYGECNAMIDLTVINGTAPFSYEWSDPSFGNIEDPINVCPGDYTVTVTDDIGCTAIINTPVFQPGPLLASAVATDVSCNGACDGTVNVSVSGGFPPYSYSWSGPCEGPNPIDVCAGTFTVTVTDGNGCTVTSTVTISEPSPVEPVVTCTPESAPGANDGSCTVQSNGGVPGYTEEWSNGVIGQTTITDLPSGTYCVTVTDSEGCTGVSCGEVNTPGCDISLEIAATTIACFDECNGAIDIQVVNGSMPFTYEWSEAGIGDVEDPVNLCAGTYNLTVTDADQCTSTINVTVEENPQIFGTLIFTQPSCNNNCDGMITTSIDGGTEPYTYSWSNGETTDSLFNLCVDEYTLTITDALGCSAVFTPTVIIVPPSFLVSGISTNPSCIGDCDGSISLTATGGIEPYDYDWNIDDYDGMSQIVDLCPMEYIVTVTDDLGCSVVYSEIIEEPTELMISTSTTNACFEECDGTAIIVVTGGSGPYTYEWSGDQEMLCPGNYEVTVTDANSCSIIGEFIIEENPEINYSIDNQTNEMNTEENGAIEISVSGGTFPFEYDWKKDGTSVSTEEDPDDLAAGTYVCEITDANGCTIFTEEVIIDNIVSVLEPSWADQITIFPNPTKDLLNIDFNLNESFDIKIEVFDMRGVRIFKKRTRPDNSENEILNLDRFVAGVYTLRISSEDSFYTFKIVKME